MVHVKMMLAVRPLSDKILRNNNSTVRVVEKSLLALPSVLDFCGSLKMRILPLYNWNRIAYVYPVPSVVTWYYRSHKESFDHDKDYHTSDDSPKTSPKKKIEGPDGNYEPAENILTNIMLVDDDKDILFTFKSILEAEGYKVQAFADPNEALSHFIQMEPSYYNLVLTDIRMPNFNGFQLYQKLKEINTSIRVIFMTAFDVPGNLADTLPAIKESDIIKKPIEEERFVNKIRDALRME
jgi:CheY-like chemotaxis protein